MVRVREKVNSGKIQIEVSFTTFSNKISFINSDIVKTISETKQVQSYTPFLCIIINEAIYRHTEERTSFINIDGYSCL